VQIRVYYEDTDAGGIVYHTNYIKYCERARSELFFQKNKMPLSQNSGFVVRKIEADFLGTATLGDILEVTTKVINKKAVSILLQQEIYKEKKKIFSMKILLAFVKEGKLSPIPNDFQEILN
jgi:acyl-CoA thioester hydrolase